MAKDSAFRRSQAATLAQAPADANSRIVTKVIFVVLVSVTVLQRFAVPGTGGRLGAGFVLAFGAFMFGLLNGVFRVSLVRVLLYVAMTSILLVLIFTLRTSFSILSMAMLFILYIPFVTVAPMQMEVHKRILMLYQGVMTFCALCGIIQFLAQFAIGPQGMFPFDYVLQTSFFQSNFNLMIPIADGSRVFKSTGLWFLEPSIFSQFLGLSLIIELLYVHRPLRIALFGIAYIPSFSGTGAVLLGIGFLSYTIRHGKFLYLLAVALSLVIIVVALHDVSPFSLFLDRMGEFSNVQASGSMRFLAPYRFVDNVIASDPMRILFGFGAGSMSQAGMMLDYKVQDTAWLKMLCEYGIVGTIPFLIFYLYCMFWRTTNMTLSLSCVMQSLLLGGYLNQFYIQFLHLVLIGWPRIDMCAKYKQLRSSINYVMEEK